MSRTRIGALLAVAAIAVTACGGSTATTAPTAAAPSQPAGESTAPSSAPASETPSQAAGTPTDGGSIVVGLPGDMVLADPSLVSDSNSSYIHQQVIEGLRRARARHDQRAPAAARRRAPDRQRRRPDVHVQAARGRQVPRRHRLQRRRRGLQLRAPEERAEGAPERLQLLLRRHRRLRPGLEPRVRDGERSDDRRDDAQAPAVELPDQPEPAAVRHPEPDGPEGRRRGQPRSGQEPLRAGPGRDRQVDGRHRPVHVQGMGPQRPRHDRQEPGLLGHGECRPPRLDRVQAVRGPDRRAERAPGR